MTSKSQLIVFRIYLEVRLWMAAYGANFWSFFTHYNMTAIDALPYHITITAKYDTIFDVFQQLFVASFVMLLYFAYQLKTSCDFGKT